MNNNLENNNKFDKQKIINQYPVGSKWYHFNFYNVQDGVSNACFTEVEIIGHPQDLIIEYKHINNEYYDKHKNFSQKETYQNFRCNSFVTREDAIKSVKQTYINNIIELNIKISKELTKLNEFAEFEAKQ